MNVEEDVTCTYCKNIYNDPVFLNCCGNNICKQHIDSILAKKETIEEPACPLCNTEIQNQTFHINRPLKNLIEKRELHNLKLDPKFENTLINFKDKIENMEKLEKDPDSIIYESISELKRQVDLDREQLKEKIDQQADEIIKTLESLEIEFKQESKAKVKEAFDEDFKKSLNDQLREYEKTLNSLAKTNEEREIKRLEVEETLKNLQVKLNQLETALFSNKIINYEPFSKKGEDFFGELDIIEHETIKLLMFGTTKQQLEVTKRFRNLLSTDSSSAINKVISAGLVPKFVELLLHDNNDIRFEAVCALTNITAGNSLQTKCVVEAGAVPVLVKMLSSTSENLQMNVVSCLDNIVVDGPEFRDLTLDHGVLSPLLKILSTQTDLKLKKNAVLFLYNICSGQISPFEFTKIEPALPILALLLNNEDQEILTHACWALSIISNDTSKVQELIELDVCPRLVKLLKHSSLDVVEAALSVVGNIVAGNDAQAQVIVDCNGSECLLKLLSSPKESIRQDTCLAIRNKADSNIALIQAVLDANIFPKLIEIIAKDENETKIEAAWIVANITSAGTPEQIKYLVELNTIQTLCDMLTLVDGEHDKILVKTLLSLGGILKLGKQSGDYNPYESKIRECGGLDKIQCLKSHQNECVSKIASLMVDIFFAEEEDANNITQVESMQI